MLSVLAPVVRTETTIESGAKVVIARGPHKGLRYAHLGDGACAGAESSGKSRGKNSFGGEPATETAPGKLG